MPSFTDVYLVPDIGQLISTFFNIRDDARLDSTNKEIRDFHRAAVYPLYNIIDLDAISEEVDDPVPYLKKMTPFAEKITSTLNPGRLGIPTVRKMRNLREVTYAVPLVVDTTLRRIHPTTYRFWELVDSFLQSLFMFPNAVETVNIVPGAIVLVRTDPDRDDFLEEHVLNDTTEGSHLQIYRRYGMPVVMNVHKPAAPTHGTRLSRVHLPGRLASYGMKNLHYEDWNTDITGIASLLLDLID